MKNLLLTKKLFLVALLLFVNVFASNASVVLNGFTIYDNFLKSGKLSVTNPSNSTPFKFRLSLTRQVSGGVYADGSCTITLVYKTDVNSSVETVISTAKNVTNSDYKNSVFANVDNIDATLPANITNGVVQVKWTYYNTNQQKTVTEYEARYVVTVLYSPPAPVVKDILDLVTYPARRGANDISTGEDNFGAPIELNTIGIKLPDETLTVTWKASLLSAGNVRISLIYGTSTVSSVIVGNTGTYTIDFSSIPVGFYVSQYQVLIEDLSGNKKLGRSGVFRFHKDHPNLWAGQQEPNGFQNSSWVFPPHDGGSGDGSLTLKWMSNEIAALNVSVDLLYPDGTFYKRLTASTPNDGSYIRPYDSSIPMNSTSFYQFKITSVENPSIFGYSELHHHYID